ncbi:cb155a8f-14e1-480f-8b67-8437d815b828 [Thermothielavioides terrestris]|uniref:Cb155a8f-14e1-480f-8b67-8437d815b828 n=1 Tax=Thermothielavioides terrestris TaxID=2587410 RepID=A0A3S4BIZ7_9PEZI|nr:cb155a8f-14e1-480f-8b67-8437d815b828 [Thermothielavioides terrestris]
MPASLTIQLVNQSTSENVYAYITGLAIQHGMARVFLKADGTSLYFPGPPPAGKILQPLTENCAIPLGPPGNTVTATIPQMAGGRIWFSVDDKLTFLRNPGGPGGGAALVEPSVLNPSDPNADVDFAFCEFTLNNDQLFANISYVDFVPRLPIALTLQTHGGAVQHVSGMPPDGLDKPQTVLRINTQSAHGTLKGTVPAASPNQLVIGGEAFARPTTADILGCNSGPFATGGGGGASAVRNAIIPRLAAAFQRGCVAAADVSEHPSHPETFYRAGGPANHYARIVHECNLDGKGYAFAYDDVQPDGGEDQSGKVNAGDPRVLVVAVGGGGAPVRITSTFTFGNTSMIKLAEVA